MQQYKNNLRITTVPYTFEKTFDEIRSGVEIEKLKGERNGIHK
jgi:hypothetical protein